MIQRSAGTGRHVFYPRVAAPGTGETDLEWVESPGTGTVYASTVTRTREGNYNIALIDLDEGVRMMSRVENIAPEAVKIGQRVRARIATENGSPIVVFDPA